MRGRAPAAPASGGRLHLWIITSLCILAVLPGLVRVVAHDGAGRLTGQILFSVLIGSVLGFGVTVRLIPLAGEKIIKTLSGVDIGKKGLGFPDDGIPIPESMGLVSGMMFLVCIVLTQAVFGHGRDNPHFVDYHAALISVCFTMLLGLADDVIDLRWGQKMVVGAIASIPLCVAYDGPTTIVVPKQLRFLLINDELKQQTIISEMLGLLYVDVPVEGHGAIVDLAWVYLLFILFLAVFCTNAVNIYAGINGLEAGQSLIIGFSIIIMDLLEIGAQSDTSSEHAQNHIFSLMVMIPFVCTTLGLLYHNWYPAKVFVGDVYPYYAGMTFATCAILGHYTKSLLLLVIPQLLNFLYSIPQLFGFVPIPRHRLPRINLKTGLLEASTVGPNDSRTNMTLLCLALRLLGPMNERTLCIVLMAFQALCAILGLSARYYLAQALFIP